MSSYEHELEVALAAARAAGAVAMAHFGGPLQVQHKPDGQGPVSNADLACDALIRQHLAAAFPDDALLTEETVDDGAWHTAKRVWMVDPIDGTQEYVNGIAEFAVMIGLCVDAQPVLGVVFAPAQDLLLAGIVGAGAFAYHGEQQRALQAAVSHRRTVWRAAISRSHPSAKVEQVLEALGQVERQRIGSVGLKISAVAHGDADLYAAATGKIKLWDTCGPHAVLAAAGGVLVDFGGQVLDYQQNLVHPRGLLASAADVMDTLLATTKPLVQQMFSSDGAV